MKYFAPVFLILSSIFTVMLTMAVGMWLADRIMGYG